MATLVTVMLATANVAGAQPDGAPAPRGAMAASVDEIVVSGIRDPAFVHYADIAAYLQKFDAFPANPHIHMVLRIIPRKAGMDVENIEVHLSGDDGFSRPLPTYPGGRVLVVQDEEALRKHADFVIHAKRGTVATGINVIFDFGGTEVPYRTLMSDMEQADKRQRVLMTPMQRLEFSPANAIILQAKEPNGNVVIDSKVKGLGRFVANRKGLIIIPYIQVVYDENPMVSFSGTMKYGIAIGASGIHWGNR
jgi:hypothetical protein